MQLRLPTPGFDRRLPRSVPRYPSHVEASPGQIPLSDGESVGKVESEEYVPVERRDKRPSWMPIDDTETLQQPSTPFQYKD